MGNILRHPNKKTPEGELIPLQTISFSAPLLDINSFLSEITLLYQPPETLLSLLPSYNSTATSGWIWVEVTAEDGRMVRGQIYTFYINDLVTICIKTFGNMHKADQLNRSIRYTDPTLYLLPSICVGVY